MNVAFQTENKMNFKRRSIVPLIQETFQQDQYSDMTLLSCSQSFSCHKLVLAVVSPYIGDLLLQTQPTDQVEIVISGTSDQDIQQFLSYAYGVCPLVPDTLKFLTQYHGLSENQKDDLQVKCEIEEDISSYLEENHEENSEDENNVELQPDTKEEVDYEVDESDRDSDSHFESKERNINSIICVVGETGRRRRKYSCPYCDLFFYQLSRHVFSTHPDKWKEFDSGRGKTRQVREREYPKKCEMCPRYLSCKYHYERHVKSHQEKSVKAEMRASETESFVCDQCGASYSQVSLDIDYFSPLYSVLTFRNLLFSSTERNTGMISSAMLRAVSLHSTTI